MSAQVLPHTASADLIARRRQARAALEAAATRRRPNGRGDRPQVDELRFVEEVGGLVSESEMVRRGLIAQELQRPLIIARRVDEALERLRALPTIHELERAVPSELGMAGGFERVLYSRVEGSMWRPVSWQTETVLDGAAQARFREFFRGPEIQLVGGSVESEVIRRRMSALVSDADAAIGGVAPVIGVVGSNFYIVAPVIAGDQVVALVHADTEGGRGLTETDRIAVQAFADGLGLALERLGLQQQLIEQQQRITQALEVASRTVEAVGSAPVRIAVESNDVAPAAAASSAPAYTARLTDREREVFELLVAGATNGQIADRLTVSETTVKSHVKHILRKLHVTNRAEAIAQFLKTRTGGVS